jgi:polar amino acid transport system substrate-binding protein
MADWFFWALCHPSTITSNYCHTSAMENTSMRYIVISFMVTFASISLAQDQSVTLGNEPWPPYILSGEKKGTAERIVCEALERAGWGCTVKRGGWVETLQLASDGELDGIAALWYTKERTASLKYSVPYLTNRLLPVVRKDSDLVINSLEDLSDLRIVTEENYAYGENIENALSVMSVTQVRGFENTLAAVQNNEADVALIDELAARDYVDQPGNSNLIVGQAALSYRELHFAVSKSHPQHAEIIVAFNEAYYSMLKDGSINRILDIDWVVTDLKLDGVPDFIYRSGENPTESEPVDTVYAINQTDYQMIRKPGFTGANANFERNEMARDDFRAATGVEFKEKKPCHYDSASGRVICPMK